MLKIRDHQLGEWNKGDRKDRPYNKGIISILSEFARGLDALAPIPPCVAIFGSARAKPEDSTYIAAVETARLLAREGFGIITGGGPGIMEAGNKGAREGGGASIGCLIDLPSAEAANAYLDISPGFQHFFIRKTMFVTFAQAFIVFPGGFGTMDELFEILALVQTKKADQCPVILYDSQYWAGLVNWIRGTMVDSNKILPQDAELLLLSDDPQEICSMVIEANAVCHYSEDAHAVNHRVLPFRRKEDAV